MNQNAGILGVEIWFRIKLEKPTIAKATRGFFQVKSLGKILSIKTRSLIHDGYNYSA